MQSVQMTAGELIKTIRRKEISSHELVEIYVDRIKQYDPQIKSYLTLTEDTARKEGLIADENLSGGNEKFLGIPIAVKDNICTEGIRTTCASLMLDDFVPPYDATVIKKIKKAGLPILGKTNLDEFAMGSSTENSGMQITANPWDQSRVPGGSSGGSAAAVVAGLAPWALGTDTGGSIRQPASFCGVVGMKPSYGRVSRYGLVAYASSLDQIGVITRDVKDCALLLDIISGHDSMDSTSLLDEELSCSKDLKPVLTGLKVGMPVEYFQKGLDPTVRTRIEEAALKMQEAGAVVKEVSLPHTEYALASYYIIASAEAGSNLARYDGVRYGYCHSEANIWNMFKKTRQKGFGREVKRRIMLGTYALSAGYYDAYYLKASKVRTLIAQDFTRAFSDCDVLLTPTSPTVAFKIGEKIADPLVMYLSDVYTIPVNLAGLPAVNIPCGFNEEGLPIGLQLIGPYLKERQLLQAALGFEEVIGPLGRKIPELNREPKA
jgi:aspartyl-tRNA(Asn)/glutamyl-tRNA(Gln) amidotransferase subunit A